MIDLDRPFEIVPYVFISRAEWGAKPPLSTERFKEYPIHLVVVRFTDTEKCYTKEQCSRVLRQMQQRDMEAGEPDVKHNFMVGGDWSVYEGRGWKYIAGDPLTEDSRGTCLDVAYIGPSPQLRQINYPPLEMKHAYVRILEFGMRRGLLDTNFNLDTHGSVFTHIKESQVVNDPITDN